MISNLKRPKNLNLLIICLAFIALVKPSYASWTSVGLPSVKPRTWVITDVRRTGTSGDADDIVATAMFFQFANYMDILGYTAGADKRSKQECGDAADWVTKNIYAAYKKELPNMNKHLGGFQEEIPIYQSPSCGEQFSKTAPVIDINAAKNLSMKKLIEAAEAGPLWLSVWGELTEFAEVAKYLLANNKPNVLKNMLMVPHWIYPKNMANCAHDAGACDYVYELSNSKKIDFYNIGPVGQYGLVDNSCNSASKFPIDEVIASAVGKFVEIKITGGTPDMSDASSFLVLFGIGGGIASYKNDGTYDEGKIKVFCEDRAEVWKAWKRAALAAKGEGVFNPPIKDPITSTSPLKFMAGNKLNFESDVLKINSENQGSLSVEIFDFQGHSVFQSSGKAEIPLNLKDGLYFVKINDSFARYWDKIWVLH